MEKTLWLVYRAVTSIVVLINFLLSLLVKLITSAWQKFREDFRKPLNRRKKAFKSGAATSTCKYFNKLSFLNDVIGVRYTQSNIQEDHILSPPPSPAFSIASPVYTEVETPSKTLTAPHLHHNLKQLHHPSLICANNAILQKGECNNRTRYRQCWKRR